jgi:hypothetical protein
LEADSYLSFLLSIYVFLHSEGIENIPLIFSNWILAKLVTEDDTTLGMLSKASLKIFVVDWVPLNVACSGRKLWLL